MKRLSLMIVSGALIASPLFFAGCSDRDDNGTTGYNTSTDRGEPHNTAQQLNHQDQAPDNVKDNYIKDNSTTNRR